MARGALESCCIRSIPPQKKVLTENLRELEDLGIITRTAHQGNTLKVVYRLTERGAQLQPIFNELILWSLRYSE